MKLEPIVLPKDMSGAFVTGNGIETIRKSEIEYYNEDNERSVYNIAPKSLKGSIKNPEVQKMLLLPERELREQLKPNPTLCRLRISFWREFDRAQSRMEDMKLFNISSGICSTEEFYHIAENPNHAAWLLKPPADYVNSMEEALIYGIERLREVLELPLMKKESLRVGKDEFEVHNVVDIDAANVILKTVALLDMRVKGALVQKVEQRISTENKNINATLNATMTIPSEAVAQIPVEELDKKLLQLQKDISKSNKSVSSPFTKKELKHLTENKIAVSELPEYEVLSGKITGVTRKEDPVADYTISRDDFESDVDGL